VRVDDHVSDRKRLDHLRHQIEQWLDNYTAGQVGTPPRLLEAIRYSLLAGGKRLRPILVMLAAELCGGSSADALPAAGAIEMLHTYSLVHDDLPAMDDDDLRRGQPTCHVRYDEATAILVGDALLTMSFEVLGSVGRTPEITAACVRALATGAGSRFLIGGQFDDLAAENCQLTIEALERIHLRKTAQLFSTAAELGGWTGGGSAAQIERLAAYGRWLGLAFQIQDDLLDVQGQENRLGKRAQKDQTRGKSTYPSLLGIDASQQRCRELIELAIEQLADWGEAAGTMRRLAQGLLHRTH
jgi:geranylgeranyl diphosphate synthase type II